MRERARPLPPWLMKRDVRGAIKACGLCCMVFLAVGIIVATPLGAAVLAAGERSSLPAVPAPAADTTIELSKTALLVGGRQTYVYRPVLADASSDALIAAYIAGLLEVEVDALAVDGQGVAEPEISPCGAPEDLCPDSSSAALVGHPGVNFVVACTYQPTPAITSVRVDLTRVDPGSICQTVAGTLVFDAALGRPVELADLFAIDETTLARLTALVAGRMPIGQVAAGVPVPPVDFHRFLVMADGIGFSVGNQAGSPGPACTVVVPYRALTGTLRARIGYPSSPDQSYPAYIEIRPVERGDHALATDAGPVIALTFDDGPNDTGTHAILAELSKRRAVATFCVIGVNSVRRQEILQDIVLQGSEIGNHTWRHWDLSQMSGAEVAVEIAKVQRLVESATGIAPAFVRPPAGHAGPIARRAFGLPAVYWSIDPYDWRGASAEAIAAHVIERARDGDIVLLHDTAPNTAAATGMILDELGARGFRFVTVSELLDLASGKVLPGSIWRNRAGG